MSQLALTGFNSSALVPKQVQQTSSFIDKAVSLIPQTVSQPFASAKNYVTQKCYDLIGSISGVPKTALVEYTSTFIPTCRLSNDFWKSQAGRTLVEIKNILHTQKILPDQTDDEFKGSLENRLWSETANSGEVFAHLIKMSGYDHDIQQSTIILALLQKIETMIYERHDDFTTISENINKSYETEREELFKGFSKELDKYKQTRTYTDISNLEEMGSDIIKAIIEKTVSVKQKNSEMLQNTYACNRASAVLCELETSLFQNKDIFCVSKQEINNIESAKKHALELSGTTDTLFVRCIRVNNKHIAQDSISAAIDGDKCLYFAPRVGQVRLSKRDAREMLEGFLSSNLNNGNSIQITVWKKAAPKIETQPTIVIEEINKQ